MKKQACVARRCINLAKRQDLEEEHDFQVTDLPPPLLRDSLDALGPLREVITPEANELGVMSGKPAYVFVGSPTGVMEFPIDGPLPVEFTKAPAAVFPTGLGEWALDEMPLQACCDDGLPSMPLRGDEFAGLAPAAEPCLDDWWF